MASVRFEVRKTEASDLQSILDMIQELADYEKMSDGPKLKRVDLLKDGGFEDASQLKFFHSFVAEQISSDEITSVSDAKGQTVIRKPIGYTIAFFSYSTALGKCYFIEDIYVKPDYRKHGVGHLLFQENIKYALANGSKKLQLHVLDWNSPAINFYKKFGGQDLTTQKGVEFYRFNVDGMKNLLKLHS